MKAKEFVIEVRGKYQFLSSLQADMQRVQAGVKEEEMSERLFCESIDAANRLLTPKRVELLGVLHSEGPMNTHELAKFLARDYKNVRQDVIALHDVGLIVKAGRQLTVPWKEISLRIPIAA